MHNQRDDMIRERARQIWELEGRPDGRDDEFWYRAIDELDDGHSTTASAPAGGGAGADGEPQRQDQGALVEGEPRRHW